MQDSESVTYKYRTVTSMSHRYYTSKMMSYVRVRVRVRPMILYVGKNPDSDVYGPGHGIVQ